MAKNVFSESPVDTFTRDLQGKEFQLPDLSEVRRKKPQAEPSAGKLDIDYTPDDLKAPEQLKPIFDQAATTYGVPGDILQALAQQESSYRPDAIGVDTPWGRAKGIMQYIDPTADSLGINPFDPKQAINAAAKQFSARLANGYSIEEAIMAHHGGDDRDQWGPKTREYAEQVMKKAGIIGYNPNAYAGDKPPGMIAREGAGYDPQAKKPRPAEERVEGYMRGTGVGDKQEPITVAPGWSVTGKDAKGDKIGGQVQFKPGKKIEPKPENYDTFTQATKKELQNVPENFVGAIGGLTQLFGESMAEDRERGFAQSAARMGLTPGEFKLIYWAEANDLISDEMKAGKDIRMVAEQLKDELAAIPDERIQQFVVDAGIVSPERIAGFGEYVRSEQEADKVKVNAEPGSMGYYGSQTIRSIAENLPALAMSVATRNPAYALGDIGVRTMGASYGDARDKGLSPEKSREYATTMALAEIVPSTVPVARFMKPGSGLLKDILGDTVTEGAQEAITAALQAGIDKDYISPDMSLKDALIRIGEGALIGTMAGAGMSGTLRTGQKAADIAGGGEKGRRGRALADEIERSNRGEFTGDLNKNATDALDPRNAQMSEVTPEGQGGFGSDVMQGREAEQFNDSFEGDRLDGRVVDEPAEAPEGPLSRATQDAARESELEGVKGERVKVRTQTGVIDGIVSEYTEDGQGNFNARILDTDTGELFEYTQDDPIEIMRAAGPRQDQPEEQLQPQDMSTSEIMDELESLDLTVDPNKPVEQARAEQRRAEMLKQEMQNRGLDAGGQSTDYADMNEQQLRDSLKSLAQQAKQSGWNKALLDERKQIEGYIEEIKQVDQQGTGLDEQLAAQADQLANVDRAEQQALNAMPDEPPVTGERRQDLQTRRRVADMSPEEMQKALLEDDLTGLGNRRAYNENPRKPVQVSVDADSLKWVNDNMSHGAGDEMLRAIGRAFQSVNADAYHPSGDEFWLQADTQEEADAIMQQVSDELAGAIIEFELPSGEIITKRGIGLSYGTADTIEAAEPKLQAQKAERERTGQRAGRGETPPGVTRSGGNAGVPEDATQGNEGAQGDTAERPEQEVGKQDKARQRIAEGRAWFGTEDKARDFLAKNDLESEFAVKQSGKSFEIQPLKESEQEAPEGRQLRNDGTPFTSEAVARTAIANRRLEGYQVVPVEGGFALDPIQEGQGETEEAPAQEAAPKETAADWRQQHADSAKSAGLNEGQYGFGLKFKNDEGQNVSSSITRSTDARIRAGGKEFRASVALQEGSVAGPSVTLEFDTFDEAVESLRDRGGLPGAKVPKPKSQKEPETVEQRKERVKQQNKARTEKALGATTGDYVLRKGKKDKPETLRVGQIDGKGMVDLTNVKTGSRGILSANEIIADKRNGITYEKTEGAEKDGVVAKELDAPEGAPNARPVEVYETRDGETVRALFGNISQPRNGIGEVLQFHPMQDWGLDPDTTENYLQIYAIDGEASDPVAALQAAVDLAREKKLPAVFYTNEKITGKEATISDEQLREMGFSPAQAGSKKYAMQLPGSQYVTGPTKVASRQMAMDMYGVENPVDHIVELTKDSAKPSDRLDWAIGPENKVFYANDRRGEGQARKKARQLSESEGQPYAVIAVTGKGTQASFAGTGYMVVPAIKNKFAMIEAFDTDKKVKAKLSSGDTVETAPVRLVEIIGDVAPSIGLDAERDILDRNMKQLEEQSPETAMAVRRLFKMQFDNGTDSSFGLPKEVTVNGLKFQKLGDDSYMVDGVHVVAIKEKWQEFTKDKAPGKTALKSFDDHLSDFASKDKREVMTDNAISTANGYALDARAEGIIEQKDVDTYANAIGLIASTIAQNRDKLGLDNRKADLQDVNFADDLISSGRIVIRGIEVVPGKQLKNIEDDIVQILQNEIGARFRDTQGDITPAGEATGETKPAGTYRERFRARDDRMIAAARDNDLAAANAIMAEERADSESDPAAVQILQGQVDLIRSNLKAGATPANQPKPEPRGPEGRRTFPKATMNEWISEDGVIIRRRDDSNMLDIFASRDDLIRNKVFASAPTMIEARSLGQRVETVREDAQAPGEGREFVQKTDAVWQSQQDDVALINEDGQWMLYADAGDWVRGEDPIATAKTRKAIEAEAAKIALPDTMPEPEGRTPEEIDADTDSRLNQIDTENQAGFMGELEGMTDGDLESLFNEVAAEKGKDEGRQKPVRRSAKAEQTDEDKARQREQRKMAQLRKRRSTPVLLRTNGQPWTSRKGAEDQLRSWNLQNTHFVGNVSDTKFELRMLPDLPAEADFKTESVRDTGDVYIKADGADLYDIASWTGGKVTKYKANTGAGDGDTFITGEQVVRAPGTREGVTARLNAGKLTGQARLEALGDKYPDQIPQEEPRGAGAIAKSLGMNTTSGLINAIDGLTELFGGGKNLNSGFSFDEKTYQKAKPYFIQAARDVARAGKDLKDLFRALLDMFGTDLKPYILRFAQDLRDGEATLDGPTTTGERTLEDAIYENLEEIGDNRKLKSVVADFYGIKAADVTGEQMKDAQERIEAAITRRARDIVEAGEDVEETYNALVDLYRSQPNLNVRSSTSMQNQAYSTPAPLAYLASLQAGIDGQSTVYEPTAGNGMLLIGADPEMSTVNELNDLRAEQLRNQGFTVTQNDATIFVPDEKVDSVIANPPFGRAPEKTKVDGFNLVQIDHIIAAKALQAMADDGQATLIIGANKNTGEMSAADRVFFNWLYSNYNVDSHFEVDGKLYQRQGAGWPVRVISINGRQQSNRNSNAVKGVERADNWGRVYELFNENMDARESGADTRGAEGPDSAPATGQQQAQGQGAVQGSPGIQAGATTDTGAAGRGQRSGTTANTAGSGTRGGNTGQQRGDTQPAGSRTDGAGQSVNDGRQGTTGQRQGERGSESGVRAPGSQGVPTTTGQSDTGVAAGSDYQVAYKTKSGGFNDAVLTPVNMAEATDRALETIRQEVGGDLDQYVMDQLGYESKEDLYDAFMGLQIDAVAAGIYNMENGKGQIIADQTGVGKGRQAAAIIRYALKKGKTPVFVTVKDNLFTDMYNDLADIGTTDAKPFILNQDGKIKAAEGDLFTNPKQRAKHVKEMRGVIQTGQLPAGRNMLFMTYSQVNTDNVQREVIEALRENAVFILDESHNAAGEREKVDKKKGTRRTTAGFIYDVIDQTPVQYLSATYAKTPDNMPVYYRTDLMSAVDSAEELIEAIQAGGAPLQTVVSGMLAESGQLFRRERSFEGISVDTLIDTKRRKEHERISDTVTEGLRAIVAADKMFHSVTVGLMNEGAQQEGGLAAGGGNQAGKGVDHTHFTSVVHNFIGQMLMGLHTESTIEQAIEQHRNGIKPVIALDKTMGSFLVRYAEQNGLQQGDVVDADYRDILRHALDRTRGINYTLPNGEKETRYLTMDELTPEVRAEYDKALAIIDSLDVDLPISPIDYVRNKLAEADIEVAEITGRDTIIDYSSGKPVLAKRSNEEITDRRGTVDRFNNGELDALILNQAGSTGLSIHSAEKFGDIKPRHMIVMQPMGDINILMQMLGRINRTGQVNKPGYTMIGADIPAEKRPLARTAQKMKSLNANTSANTESDTSVNAPDILNKYGDRIVNDYLKDNLEVARMVDISPTSSDDGSVGAVPGLASKFTGRMALLPAKMQREIYEEIEAQYTNYIEYLNKTNQNDLETTVIDYQAKVIESKVSYEGIAPDTIFGGNTVVHKADVKYQGKPPTPEEVEADLKKAGDPQAVREEILQKKEQDTAALDAIKARVQERKRENEDLVAQGADEKALEEAQERLEAAVSQLQAYEMNKRAVTSQIMDFMIGRRVNLDIEGQNVVGVITGIKDNHKPGKGNPYARSKTVVSFAVPTGIRQVDLPLSQLGYGNIFQGFVQGSNAQNKIEDIFRPDLAGNDRREIRYIATGNLIAGMAKLPGRIISFTDSDGSIRQGILLPRSYNQGKDTSFSNMDETVGFPIRDAKPLANYIRQGLDGLKNDPLFDTSKEVSVTSVKGRPAIVVPKSNKGATTKQVKFNQALMDAMGTEFYGSGKYMVAQFDIGRVDQVAEALLNLVTLQGRPSQRRDWIAAGGKPRPQVANSFDTGTSRDKGRKPMLKRGAVQNDKQNRVDRLQAAQMLTNSWRNGPRVVSAEKLSDLPQELQDYVKQQGAEQDFTGVYWEGAMYLYLPNIPDGNALEATVLHEGIGHYGVMGFFGPRFDGMAQQIFQEFRGMPEAKRIIAEYFTTEKFSASNREHRIRVGAELLAHLSETKGHQKLWDKVRQVIQDILRSMGFRIQPNRTDLNKILRAGERFVKNGEIAVRNKSDAYFRRDGKAPQITDPMNMPLDELIEAVPALAEKVDQAYADGDMDTAAELDQLLEAAYVRIESSMFDIEEDGIALPGSDGAGGMPPQATRALMETQGEMVDTEAGIEDQVASAYSDYLHPGHYTDYEDMVYQVRGILEEYQGTNGGLEPGLTDEQIADMAKDVYDDKERRRARGKTGQPFLSRKPNINDMSKAERQQAQRRALSAAERGLSGEPDTINGEVISPRIVGDMGRVAKFVLHPRQVATLHKPFTPVYRTAISQFEMRDRIIDSLYGRYQQYMMLDKKQKQNVNKLLELGRIAGRNFLDKKQVTQEGIIVPGFRDTVIQLEDGTQAIAEEPVSLELSKEGDLIKLSDEEYQAYATLRDMFDEALDMFKEQMLIEFGMEQYLGEENATAKIMEDIEADPMMPTKQLERMLQIAKTIEEIEQAKRKGYVPLSRHGDYVVAVKETPEGIQSSNTKDGMKKLEDVPEEFEPMLEALDAEPVGDGSWIIAPDRYKEFMRNAGRTVYSSKVETGLRDAFSMSSLVKNKGKYEEIPSVKAEVSKVKEKYLKGKPNRTLYAFPVSEIKEKELSLSDIDTLAQLSGIDNDTWEGVREAMEDEIKARGFRRHFFHSDNTPGYSVDFERNISQYISGMGGYLSRRRHAPDFDKAIDKIKTARLRTYADNYRNYINDPEEEYAMIRQVGFLSYIAGNLSTALVNSSQVPMLTMPHLTMFSSHAKAAAEVSRAYKDAIKMFRLNRKTGLQIFDPTTAPADVSTEVMEAWAEGAFVPLETYEVMATARARGVGQRQFRKKFEKSVQMIAYTFTAVERLNRLVTFMAAVRIAKDPKYAGNFRKVLGENHLAMNELFDGQGNLIPKKFGEFSVDETQYRMGKVNRAPISRGVGAPLMQFKSFMMQTLEVFYRWSTVQGREGKMAAAAALLMMINLGGLWGFPGGEDLRDLFEKLWRMFTSEDKDLETDLRLYIYEQTNQRWLAEYVTKGVGSPTIGVDLSRIGMGQIVPDTPLDMLGIPADMLIGRPSRAVEQLAQENYAKAAAEFLPNFIANPIKALEWQENGVYTRYGTKLLNKEDVTPAIVAKKMIGLNDQRISNIRDSEYAVRRAENALNKKRSRYYAALARAMATSATSTNAETVQEAENKIHEIFTEIEQNNAKAETEDELIIINESVLNRRITRELLGVEAGFGRGRTTTRGKAERIREALGVFEALSPEKQAENE